MDKRASWYALRYLCWFTGAVWELHIHPVRGVASGQSVCLRCSHDDVYERVDAAQLPAGAPADAAGGATGASSQQCAGSVQVSQDHRLLPSNSTRIYWRRRAQSYTSAVLCCSEYFRESIRQEIRMARERFSGQDLSEELRRIQKRLDSVELLTPDIVINLLLSYRDIQVRTRRQTASQLVRMKVPVLWYLSQVYRILQFLVAFTGLWFHNQSGGDSEQPTHVSDSATSEYKVSLHICSKQVARTHFFFSFILILFIC